MNVEEIKEYYLQGNSVQSCADKYKIKFSVARRIIVGAGINRSMAQANRKYQLDERFFDVIDSEEKAYFLGFLYADGSLCERDKSVNITLIATDSYILELFSQLIGTNRPLKDRHPKHFNSQPQKVMWINSAKMYPQIIAKGCRPNKTKDLTFPLEEQVPRALLNHFIRGFFDGDGSLTVSGKLRKLSFVGTKEMMKGIQEYFIQEIGLPVTKLYNSRNTFSLVSSGANWTKKILDLIYKNATIYLTRKHEKYLKLCQSKIQKRKTPIS